MGHDLPPFSRPYRFWAMTSCSAAFAQESSAYSRFNRLCSYANSLSRFTSEASSPPSVACHLESVAELIPSCRQISLPGRPASASFKMETIGVSVNFDWRRGTSGLG